jgi:hypothetical protein
MTGGRIKKIEKFVLVKKIFVYLMEMDYLM